MTVRLPDKYDPERISELLSKIFTQLEREAKDKKLNSLKTLGSEPTDNIEELDIGLYVDPNNNDHKLVIRSQSRNWVQGLTEES